MKRLILSIFAITIFIFCNVSPVSATMIGLDILGPSEVKVGNSIQLKSEYFVSNDMPLDGAKTGELERKDVTTKTTWMSSDPEIATISSTGKVIGKKAGVTTIRVSYDEGEYTGTTNYGIVVTDKSNNINNEKSNSFKDSFSFIKALSLLTFLLLFLIIILVIILIMKNRKENN